MTFEAFTTNVRRSTQSLQTSSTRMLPYWIAAALTAAVSLVYAKIFAGAEQIMEFWFDQSPYWAFLAVPLGMVVSMALAKKISPEASGSGIPQLLAAVEMGDRENPVTPRLLNIRMIFTKIAGSCLCVAGGGVTGREGPMLQVAAGIFHWVQKRWPREWTANQAPKLQSMILAGGAAGLASAFNTPLGGIIFAIEELAKVHISHIRTYVFHAVIIAGLLVQAIAGNYLFLGKIQIAGSPQVSELIPLMAASALIGMAGAAFSAALVKILDWRSSRTNFQQVLITAFFGLLVAGVAVWGGRIFLGSGRSVIVDLLSRPDQASPAQWGLGRLLGSLFTYSGGVVGGIFAPALATGAAIGSWLSHFAKDFHHQVWILAGMVAFLTGVTRTPFTSLILVLEMTDTHNVILSLMLAAMIAQGAARLIDPVSFYERMSHRWIQGWGPSGPPHSDP